VVVGVMAEGRVGAERMIRWTTIASVIVLAAIAAIVSYKHTYLLVRRYGETPWTAALLPVSVDGMIAVSSMSLLLDSRYGRRSGALPWALLIIGSTASLAANVAVAEPSAVGRLIAGWPSCALIGSYELLMRQIRRTSTSKSASERLASYVSRTASEQSPAGPEAPFTSLGATAVLLDRPPTGPTVVMESPVHAQAGGDGPRGPSPRPSRLGARAASMAMGEGEPNL
jgi:hypothetical protein